MWLRHDTGEAATLYNRQVLGDDSPLEFDDDGYAEVDDEAAAEKLLTMHRHVERGGHGPDAASDAGEQTDGDGDGDDDDASFDAEAFVDRTPMERVIEDIEAGDADGHLDAVEDAADRDGVLDAIDDRRGD